MANTPQDDRFYQGNTLWKAFAISSVIMLLFTVWMVMDDFGREWKAYQAKFYRVRQEKYTKLIEEANGNVDKEKIKALNEQLVKLAADTKSQQKEIDKLKAEYVKLKTAEVNKVDKYQAAKGVYDVRKYEFEAHYGHKIAEGHSLEGDPKFKEHEEAALQKLRQNWESVQKLYDDANAAVAAAEAKMAEITHFSDEQKKVEKELKIARGDLDRLEGAKESAQLTLSKLVRNAPILDMANPVMRIQQIVLPTIRDDVYFAQLQKVDRCTTCHLAIDTPGFEDSPQPYKTHPKLDLILGSRSPHPIDKIGCTVCHEGRGPSVDFVRSAHTPRNEEQKKEWVKKYGWHEEHHIIEKMIPLQYVEGKCRTCHRQTEYVPRAETLNTSVNLVRGAGCYGCHRIEGWDHVRKVAPSLKKMKGKLSHDWVVKWVRNPKSFNEYARMPSQFHQENTENNPEFKQYQEAELFALVDYITGLSEDYTPNYSVGSGGNTERGKQLFGSIGCLGCHGMDDFPEGRKRFGRAPDLSTVGSKVSKNWLHTWLKNPRHYWADTTMPSLRLNDSEIADVSAYLLSKKNTEFEALEVGKPDLEVQKKVLGLYLMRDPKMAPATREKVQKVVDALSPDEVSKKLGQNALTRYGCYGCHEIKGFETTQGIGAELSEHGSKPVGKFDFALLHLERTMPAWVHQKLTQTRSFDRGLAKEYLDLLRMPNYFFNEEERNSIITMISGLTSQKIAPPAAKQMSARDTEMEEGLRMVHKYNCQGCHMVEMLHQPLPDGHPGFDDHEKKKYDLEGRVLAYYADDESLGPPPLVTEGSRVRTDFAFNFLTDPTKTLRRRLKIRMPSFQMSEEELNKIVTYWARFGNVDFPVNALKPPVQSAEMQNAAKALFNKLQCTNCHSVGQALTAAELEEGSRGLAPDLTRAYGRLRKEWIIELLKDPQKMIPGTRMPGFWPEGQSPAPEILGGDAGKQIEALADYVLSLGYARGGNQNSKQNVSGLNNLGPHLVKVASKDKK